MTTKTTTQTELQTSKAIEIFEHGFHPVLLGRGGDALKVPQLKEWQLTEYSRADVAAWPAGNNIGIRCGKMRDGRFLYVPDFDKYAADIFPAWFHEATEIIPYMVIVKTGSGYHVPLITDEPQEHGIIAGEPVTDDNGRTRTDVIIEVRGDGQQVVSPGSAHPSGKTYKIIAGGSLANIPHVSTKQYRQLIDLMRKYDKRPAKKAKRAKRRQPVQPGLFSGYNCLDYARAHIAGNERKDKDEQIRILGNGGLIITEDKASWYCHAEQVGGNVVDMIAWHKDIPLADAAEMVRAQNEDEEPKTTEAADTAPAAQVITNTADLLDHALIAKYEAITRGDASPGELVREAFGDDAVMVIPFKSQVPVMKLLSAPNDDDGTGEWPQDPKKTRNVKSLGTAVTIVPHADHFSGGLADRHDRKWQVCKREWYFRVKREARKALAHLKQEPMFYLAGLDGVDVDRLVNRWKMNSKRRGDDVVYQVYPYDAGLYAIVTNQDETSKGKVTIPEMGIIPNDRSEVFILLERFLDTPEFKTLRRHNQGYGLRFEGFAGDGRMKFLKREMIKAGEGEAALKLEQEYKSIRKKLQMVTQMARDQVTDGLIKKGYDVIKSRFTFSDLGKFANDIKTICPDLRTRSGNNAWFALQDLQCTPLEDTAKLKKTVCPCRVQDTEFTPNSSVKNYPSERIAEIVDEVPGF